MKQDRFSPNAGIAIGPILFVIAILAVLAAVMSAGNGEYHVASGADRISADIVAQANLIRNTINECNVRYSLALSTNANALASDAYPATPGSGLVADLQCTPLGTQSLWNGGTSNILLPPPTNGFNPWHYVNGGDRGRCIWATSTASNPKGSAAVVAGLAHAAGKFNASATVNANSEVVYDPASTSQKFVVWITLPTASYLSSPQGECAP